jgi:hypothetical protein
MTPTSTVPFTNHFGRFQDGLTIRAQFARGYFGRERYISRIAN